MTAPQGSTLVLLFRLY